VAADADRVSNHLEAMGLATTLGPIPASGEALVAHMRHDKKMAAGTLPFLAMLSVFLVLRKIEPARFDFLGARP